MSTITFTHIGGPTTLIEVEGWRFLTDPTFDAPGRTYQFGWGTSSRKTTAPAVPAADIEPVDAVLLTHDQHADNLDVLGRQVLNRTRTVLTTATGARRVGNNARGLRPWHSFVLEGEGKPSVTVTATPCRHGPFGSRPIVGEVTGFALTWSGQQHGALWISGDTVLSRRVRAIAHRINVGTAVLHLGQVGFPLTGPLKYTMNGADAVELCARMKPRTVIPVHFEGWSHFRQGLGDLQSELDRSPEEIRKRFRLPPLGASIDVAV